MPSQTVCAQAPLMPFESESESDCDSDPDPGCDSGSGVTHNCHGCAMQWKMTNQCLTSIDERAAARGGPRDVVVDAPDARPKCDIFSGEKSEFYTKSGR